MPTWTIRPRAADTLPGGTTYAYEVVVARDPDRPGIGREQTGTLHLSRPLTVHDVTVQILADIRTKSGWPRAAIARGSIWTV